MTHQVHPYAHRLGILRDWKSRWFSNDPKQYREFMKCDTTIREYLEKRLRGFYVADVIIERNAGALRVVVQTSRPGLIIGRSGEGAKQLKADIQKKINKLKLEENPELKVDIEEVRSPESNAAIVGYMVAEGLEKRMPFRRVLKQTVDKVMANRDVKGVRISVGGRLGGAEMARTEWYREGRVPLHTLRADIDYGFIEARTTYGIIGVKVFVFKGEILKKDQMEIAS